MLRPFYNTKIFEAKFQNRNWDFILKSNILETDTDALQKINWSKADNQIIKMEI